MDIGRDTGTYDVRTNNQETLAIMDGQYRDTERYNVRDIGKIRHIRHRTNNPETLARNVRAHRRGNHERTTQRHWQEMLEHTEWAIMNEQPRDIGKKH